MPKINSRQKGASGELEFRDVLTAKGFTARRGQQYCGANGDPDVVCEELPHIHFEVKRTQNLNITDALQKAKSDAGEGKTPVVVWRKNYGKWMAILEADAYLDMVVENQTMKKMEKDRWEGAVKTFGLRAPYEKILDEANNRKVFILREGL